MPLSHISICLHKDGRTDCGLKQILITTGKLPFLMAETPIFYLWHGMVGCIVRFQICQSKKEKKKKTLHDVTKIPERINDFFFCDLNQ